MKHRRGFEPPGPPPYCSPETFDIHGSDQQQDAESVFGDLPVHAPQPVYQDIADLRLATSPTAVGDHGGAFQGPFRGTASARAVLIDADHDVLPAASNNHIVDVDQHVPHCRDDQKISHAVYGFANPIFKMPDQQQYSDRHDDHSSNA